MLILSFVANRIEKMKLSTAEIPKDTWNKNEPKIKIKLLESLFIVKCSRRWKVVL